MKPRMKPYGTKNVCGKTIERIRLNKWMLQGELAKAAGIDLSNMSKIEGQVRACKDFELRAIARALKVPMEELFNES